MAAASGLNNLYQRILSPISPDSPIKCIWIQTHRGCASENKITFGIRGRFRLQQDAVNEFVTTKLADLSAHLVSYPFQPASTEVLEGRASINQLCPDHITVDDVIQARALIDRIFEDGGMSNTNRADVEPMLLELEKSVQFSTGLKEHISRAQKDVIQAFVEPYIEAFKPSVASRETVNGWLQVIAKAFHSCSNERFVKNIAKSLISTESFNNKADVVESLIAIARVYATMAGLEGILERLGDGVPKPELIKEAILELFN